MSRKEKRFVIQKHTAAADVHFDFMLEHGQTLQTYRLDKAPEQILHTPSLATKIFDHSLKFLTYQGPVNKGRGSVHIVEAGTHKITHQAPNHIKLKLKGQILNGKATLKHDRSDNWLLTFEPD